MSSHVLHGVEAADPRDRHGAVDVSFVIPCLNEDEAIAAVVRDSFEALDELGVKGEVIVVDNGSGDRSAELATAAGATIVHEPRRGYGSA
jgi:glycosyltransferase involved in cell wall biosynthesis